MSLKFSDTEHKIDSEDYLYIGGQNMRLKESESSKVCLRNQKTVKRIPTAYMT